MAHLAEFTVNDKVVPEERGKFKSNNNTVRLLLDIIVSTFRLLERRNVVSF